MMRIRPAPADAQKDTISRDSRFDLAYAPTTQSNLDNNTVDMDRERANFADNTVRYEATLRFINSSMRTLNTAITGQ